MGVAEVVGGQLNGNVNAGQLQPAMSPHHSQAPFNKLGHKLSAGGGTKGEAGSCHRGTERRGGSCINESHNTGKQGDSCASKGNTSKYFASFLFKRNCFVFV